MLEALHGLELSTPLDLEFSKLVCITLSKGPVFQQAMHLEAIATQLMLLTQGENFYSRLLFHLSSSCFLFSSVCWELTAAPCLTPRFCSLTSLHTASRAASASCFCVHPPCFSTTSQAPLLLQRVAPCRAIVKYLKVTLGGMGSFAEF
jgi:hypothetical protein